MPAVIPFNSRRRSLRRANMPPSAEVLLATGAAVVQGSAVGATGRLELSDDRLRDDLTGLGSLLSLRRRLESVIDEYQPFGVRPALLMIDLDKFGRVNSAYGRHAGDGVLMATADRLRLLWGDGERYRTGSDEFVMLLESTPMVDAVNRAGAVQKALSEPVEVSGSLIPISVSVAVVMLGQRTRVDGLMRDADVTMYRAKSEGGNRVDLYNWELDSWSVARRYDVDKLRAEVQELRRQNRLLADAITHDLPTGMPNAMAFDTDLVQLYARWKRSSEPYSVLRARVDGIAEAYADFRSAAGTKALTRVAHAIRDTIRETDRAYLLDEGEFAVLLPGSTIKQAIGAAERIRGAVEKLDVEHPSDGTRKVSVTVAALEIGFRHATRNDAMAELDALLEAAITNGGPKIATPK